MKRDERTELARLLRELASEVGSQGGGSAATVAALEALRDRMKAADGGSRAVLTVENALRSLEAHRVKS